MYTAKTSMSTSRASSNIVGSPYSDVTIPDNVTISQYTMEHWEEYGDSVALVGILMEDQKVNGFLKKVAFNILPDSIILGLRRSDIC